MPKYTFECQECNTRFERTLKIGVHTAHKCPSCNEEAPIIFSQFEFSFADGKTTANSGVHKQDYPTADQAVGKSASERWAMLNRRDEVKKEARKQGKTQALIRRTGKGYTEYEPMSDLGLSARKKLTKSVIETEKATKK